MSPPIKLSRIAIGLLLVLVGTLGVIAFSGRNMHVLTPGQQLLEKMIEINRVVESSLNSSNELDFLKLRSANAQDADDGVSISVSRDGVIDGSKGDIRLRLTPKQEGGIVKWVCSGAPLDRVPLGCKTPL